MLIAAGNLTAAHTVIEELDIPGTWASVGARANLIGSVRNGLMANHLDIDYHVYSDPLDIEDSFRAVARIAARPGVDKLWYMNSIETNEHCMEWHLIYRDGRGREWKIDMIHILAGSYYDGRMERFAERIAEVVTEDQKRAIIDIKFDTPADEVIPAIFIYQAVIRDGVTDFASFRKWQESQDMGRVVGWIP